nr:immunoglobulin light chain junction region [Macaca mulatta]
DYSCQVWDSSSAQNIF